MRKVILCGLLFIISSSVFAKCSMYINARNTASDTVRYKLNGTAGEILSGSQIPITSADTNNLRTERKRNSTLWIHSGATSWKVSIKGTLSKNLIGQCSIYDVSATAVNYSATGQTRNLTVSSSGSSRTVLLDF